MSRHQSIHLFRSNLKLFHILKTMRRFLLVSSVCVAGLLLESPTCPRHTAHNIFILHRHFPPLQWRSINANIKHPPAFARSWHNKSFLTERPGYSFMSACPHSGSSQEENNHFSKFWMLWWFAVGMVTTMVDNCSTCGMIIERGTSELSKCVSSALEILFQKQLKLKALIT